MRLPPRGGGGGTRAAHARDDRAVRLHLGRALLRAAAGVLLAAWRLVNHLPNPLLQAWTHTPRTFVPQVCFALRDASWRTQTVVAALPHLAIFVSWVCFLPESPYWHLRRGEHSKVFRVLQTLLGSEVDPALLRSGGGAPVSESAEGPSAAGEGDGGGGGGGGGLLAGLCGNRRVTTITLVQIYLWSAISLSYYAISFNAGNLSDSVYLNYFLISLPLFPCAYVGPRLMDFKRLGRRGANAAFLGTVAVAIGAGAVWPAMATASSMVGTFAAEAAFSLIYLQV